MFKIKYITTLIAILCSLQNIQIQPQESDMPLNNRRLLNLDDDNIFTFDEFQDSLDPHFSDDFFNSIDMDDIIQTKIPPETIISLLESLNGIEIIKEGFFLHTNPLARRGLLDSPLFIPHWPAKKTLWSLTTHLFFTQVDRCYFTRDSSDLDSYLALTKTSLLQKLEESLASFSIFLPEFEFNIKTVFSLLGKMTVQERQTGIMFDFMRTWDRSFTRIYFPIYYLERNYFLNEKEKIALEKEFGAVDEKSQESFQKNHLVSDKLGIGDTRFEYAFEVFRNKTTKVFFGILATAPTVITIATGPNGSSFKRPSTYPTLDIQALFDDFLNPTIPDQQQSFEIITKLALNALDRLSANLLDAGLGNGGHIGVGIFEQSKMYLDTFFKKPWAQDIGIDSRISFTAFLPNTESRFFINKINTALFDQRDFNDESKAQENLAFLTQQLIERYFLRAFPARIQPGFMLRSITQFSGQKQKFGWHLGSDLWMLTQETIQSVHAPQEVVINLDIPKARIPFAYQSSLFGGIVYRIKRPLRTWYISLTGETCFSHTGVGATWGLTFNIRTTF